MSSPVKSPSPREARLAAALRDNLKRRKAQMRARAGAGGASGTPETTPDTGPEAKLNQTADTPAVRESPQSGGE